MSRDYDPDTTTGTDPGTVDSSDGALCQSPHKSPHKSPRQSKNLFFSSGGGGVRAASGAAKRRAATACGAREPKNETVEEYVARGGGITRVPGFGDGRLAHYREELAARRRQSSIDVYRHRLDLIAQALERGPFGS